MAKKIVENNSVKSATNKKFKHYLMAGILLFVFALSIGITMWLIYLNRDLSFKPQALDLPVSDQYALKNYNFDELDEVQTTLRADTMYITERNVSRPIPKLVSDEYTISSTNPNYSETINFSKYPSPISALSKNDFTEAAYAMAEKMGLSLTTEQDKADAKTKYLFYYKYFLLSQSNHLINDVQTRSANGTLTQDTLFKHPGIDLQYGAVKGENNAVEKVIVLDTSYRALHTTGLYLAPGEAVTVKVEGLKDGEKLSMQIAKNDTMGWAGNASTTLAKEQIVQAGGTYKGNYFADADFIAASNRFYNLSQKLVNEETDESYLSNPLLSGQWNRQSSRLPMLSSYFQFAKNGTYTIGSPFGGIMHINMNNCYSPAKLTIKGAVETPHYILGVTTTEYFDTYLRDAPGVYSSIDTENGQLIGPAVDIRKVKSNELEKLAMLWHSFFAVNESFTGGAYNRNNVVTFDIHVPAGAAVSLGGGLYACPPSWYTAALQYWDLIRNGGWGILHEIGHGHSNSYGVTWGLNGNQEGEVRNNALIALNYIELLDIGTTRNSTNGNISASHGFVAHPYSNLSFSQNIPTTLADFNNYDYFQALSVYVNIMHSFGVDKFYELLYSYKLESSYIVKNTAGNRRSEFAYRCSLVFGMDFRKYFNEMYKTAIVDEMFSESQRQVMSSLPLYEPIANLYAGGIDGVKTGGDFKVNFGTDISLDLKGKTISSNPNFEILKVYSPEHGKISFDKTTGICTYKFNKKYFGTFDEFNFTIKQSNGQIHTFTVYLRISYNSVKISHFDTVLAKNLTTSVEEIKTLQPKVSFETSGGISNYSNKVNGVNEVKESEFYYRAEYSGDHTFYAKCDDFLKVYFGNDFDSLEEKLSMNITSGYTDKQSFTVSLQKGVFYAFKLHNLNSGGVGYANIGLKNNSSNSISNISTSNIVNPTLPREVANTVVPYVFEPSYVVSKKDNVLNGSISTPKTDWKVLQAPENILNGRFFTEIQYDENDPSIVIKEIQIDKWDYLIDGYANTLFHTIWRGQGIKPPTVSNPDVFVIDTKKVQPFNYFTINTRNSSDALIKKYDLLISSDNVNFKTVSSGDVLEFKNGTVTLNFPSVTGRYWKLLVKETTGVNFTIIGELSAGTTAKAQRVLPITSSKLYSTKGWNNSKYIDNLPTGLMIANKKNSKMVIKFTGDQISLFASKAAGYGSATVKIDGKTFNDIDLNSSSPQSKQLVFAAEGLKNKTHILEIITNGDEMFNLNYIGLTFDASLLNASNIYLERGLAITLTIFIILFALAITFILIVIFNPKIRKKLFVNKSIENLDKKFETKEEKRKQQKLEKAEQKQFENKDKIKQLDSKSEKIKQLDNKSESEKVKLLENSNASKTSLLNTKQKDNAKTIFLDNKNERKTSIVNKTKVLDNNTNSKIAKTKNQANDNFIKNDILKASQKNNSKEIVKKTTDSKTELSKPKVSEIKTNKAEATNMQKKTGNIDLLVGKSVESVKPVVSTKPTQKKPTVETQPIAKSKSVQPVAKSKFSE